MTEMKKYFEEYRHKYVQYICDDLRTHILKYANDNKYPELTPLFKKIVEIWSEGIDKAIPIFEEAKKILNNKEKRNDFRPI